jgi:hypothetical protein
MASRSTDPFTLVGQDNERRAVRSGQLGLLLATAGGLAVWVLAGVTVFLWLVP